VYGTTRYVVADRKDGGGGSKRRRSNRRRNKGSVSDELARAQIERVERSQKVDSNHVVLLRENIHMLESRVSKMDELLCSTREMSKHRTQELERKCMSMRQVNVALERRLVLSMQENENMKIKYDEGYATTAAIPRRRGDGRGGRNASTPARTPTRTPTRTPARTPARRNEVSPPATPSSTSSVDASPSSRLFGRASNLSSSRWASPARRGGGNATARDPMVARERNNLGSGGRSVRHPSPGSNGRGVSTPNSRGGGNLGRRMSEIVFGALKKNRIPVASNT